MPYRNQGTKIVPARLLFSVLLLWILGTGVAAGSALQLTETPSLTNDIFTQTNQPKERDTETASPSVTPTVTESNAGLLPSETPTPMNADTSITKPLPAIFTTGAYAVDELVVRFKSSIRAIQIEECIQSTDAQIQGEIEELQAWVLQVKSGDLAQSFDHIQDCPGVMYVEPNFLLQAADTIPNDPSWDLQYGLVNIRAPQGWDLTTGSAAVTIAIVDTGVDYGHPDLVNKLVPGYNFVNGDPNPQDDNGHGTHVAGIAAASSNNGIGIAGVSWGARIMPVKVLNSSGGGTYANTALGVIWAVEHGAQVINLSLGGTGPSSVLADAINYAHSQGAVVIAAAGNTRSNFVLYPARYPNVIAVARTNSTNNWDGSNYGPEIDLAAPGTSIYSTTIGGYDYNSGSSMSTGFVSGLAAILKGIPGNTSPDAIESQMETTALDIEFAGWDEYTGAGLIQMDTAIQLAWPPTLTPEDHGPSSEQGRIIQGQIVPTNTAIPTWTGTPTITTETSTATPIVEATYTTGPTATRYSLLFQAESEVEAQTGQDSSNNTLFCAGILFILLGIIWMWFFTRKRKQDS